MKKLISILFAALVIASSLSACTSMAQSDAVIIDEEAVPSTDEAKTISIVTTIFPEYDWVMEILGDKKYSTDVTMLLDNGVDLHSYSPTAEDMMTVANCDLFIYVGGESDEWVNDALKEKVNPDMKVINLMEVLGSSVKEEEIVEGMEAEEEEAENGEEAEEIEYDEHVWLSLKNAAILCDKIASEISEIDPVNTDFYMENANTYIEKLNELDKQYADAVSSGIKDTLLFGDRFPFRYMVDDYNLKYYAAFVGCSAETEASFETIAFLAGKVDELGLNSVLTIEGADHRIAETIVQNTLGKDQEILTLNSMQSTTSGDVQNGETYLGIMENNLEVLKEALK
ncbi:metal ABC transporter substrate-binding protein [Butyrivibrio sp. AC2005]|uniref:metal ABC transporter substrate-binding protein n=1 Tax=Butyrivibrio sp. AC2005 TaxID=1280672 RepID=UPI0003F8D764|nr:metal ABC transporter substrate-binding protein [Butyrivibrio sp. AC2005]